MTIITVAVRWAVIMLFCVSESFDESFESEVKAPWAVDASIHDWSSVFRKWWDINE